VEVSTCRTSVCTQSSVLGQLTVRSDRLLINRISIAHNMRAEIRLMSVYFCG